MIVHPAHFQKESQDVQVLSSPKPRKSQHVTMWLLCGQIASLVVRSLCLSPWKFPPRCTLTTRRLAATACYCVLLHQGGIVSWVNPDQRSWPAPPAHPVAGETRPGQDPNIWCEHKVYLEFGVFEQRCIWWSFWTSGIVFFFLTNCGSEGNTKWLSSQTLEQPMRSEKKRVCLFRFIHTIICANMPV